MERLQKIISAAGVASRRKAEEFITSGRVQVNGQIVTELGTKADAEKDHIRVDGKLLKRVDHHVYLLLNKPKGYVTTLSDPEGRPTIVDLLHGVKTRVYPVGRLDYASEGLLLLTNDGEIANALTKAASHVPKTYLVKVDGQPNDAAIERLRLGISLPDRKGVQTRTAPAGIQLVHKAENPWYEVTLIEGRNRQVRKMFEETGHHVEKLKRVRYGPFTLDVHPGKFRYLKPEEVEQLQAAVQRGESSPEDTRVVLDAHIASDTRSPKSNYADFEGELENELKSAAEEIVPSALPPRKPARSTKTPPARTEAPEFEDRPAHPAAPFKATPFKAGSFKTGSAKTGSVKTGSFKPRAGGPREAKSRRDGFKRNDFRKFDARRADGRDTSPKAGKPRLERARVETGASPVRSYPPGRPSKTFSKGPARPSRMESRSERPIGKKPNGPRANGFGTRPSGGPARKWTDRPASSDARAPQGARRPNGFGPRGDRTQSARPHSERPRSDRPRTDRPQNDRPAGRNSERPRRDASASPRPEFRAQRPDWKKPDAARSNFSGSTRPDARPGPRTPRSGRPSGKPGKWVKGVSASIERPSPRVAKSREEFRPKSRVREIEPRSEEQSPNAEPRKNQAQPFWKKAAEKRRPARGKKNRPH